MGSEGRGCLIFLDEDACFRGKGGCGCETEGAGGFGGREGCADGAWIEGDGDLDEASI